MGSRAGIGRVGRLTRQLHQLRYTASSSITDGVCGAFSQCRSQDLRLSSCDALHLAQACEPQLVRAFTMHHVDNFVARRHVHGDHEIRFERAEQSMHSRRATITADRRQLGVGSHARVSQKEQASVARPRECGHAAVGLRRECPTPSRAIANDDFVVAGLSCDDFPVGRESLPVQREGKPRFRSGSEIACTGLL